MSVRAGYSETKAKGVELKIASRMIPPPRAVSADAIKIPQISRLFLIAIKKPLIVKAIMPIISAYIK